MEQMVFLLTKFEYRWLAISFDKLSDFYLFIRFFLSTCHLKFSVLLDVFLLGGEKHSL